MKSLSLISILLLASLSAAMAEKDREAIFAQAKAAYDAGRYAEAEKGFGTLVSNGLFNAELEYDLGNACFKSGHLPQAVLHYRRAGYLKPRDPDVEANLTYALDAAGAIPPAFGPIEKALLSLSEREWTHIAIGAYLLLTVALSIGLSIRMRRARLLRLLAILLLPLLPASLGLWNWHRLKIEPEAVVAQTGVTARCGPLPDATAHYRIPLGALLRIRNRANGDWIEVEYDQKTGWVRKEQVQPVSP